MINILWVDDEIDLLKPHIIYLEEKGYSLIAAKSGVTKNIRANSTIAGFPAIDIKLWKKKIITQYRNLK